MTEPDPPAEALKEFAPITAQEHLPILIKAVEQSPVSVIITDPRGVIQYVNPKFTRLMGYTPEEAVGQTPRIIKGGFLTREFYQEMWDTINAGQEWHGLFHNRTKDGRLVWELASISPILDETGAITHFVGVKEDMTTLKELQDQMAHLAHHDQLTGLPNRFLFHDRLAQALASARRRGVGFALLYLDLDGFKPVNDQFGHEAGDALLIAVGDRLLRCVRAADTVARMGGDEFTVLLPEIDEPAHIRRVVELIMRSLEEPFAVGEGECRIGLSIGIARYPQDGDTSDGLLSRADTAMYEVKTAGPGGYRFAGG